MGRSQRHKVVEQGIASNEELIAQGEVNWEVKQEIGGAIEDAQANKPLLSSLNPNTAAISDPDFTIQCLGSNFTENSKIIWMGAEEPTTFVSPTEVTTLVKPSVVSSPTTIEVLIRTTVQGHPVDTPPQTFTWTEAATVAGARGRN